MSTDDHELRRHCDQLEDRVTELERHGRPLRRLAVVGYERNPDGTVWPRYGLVDDREGGEGQ
jgi:hypothetical protein